MAAFVAFLLAAGASRAEAPDLAPADGQFGAKAASESAGGGAAPASGSSVTSTPGTSGVPVPGSTTVADDSSAAPKGDAANADDPESQAEVDKSAAELEEVRKAEEKAGLLPQAPGVGPHDGLAVGLDRLA